MRTSTSASCLVRSFVLVTAAILLCCILGAAPVAAMKNPSTVYCEAMGYQYTSAPAPDGGVIGMCTIPGSGTVDAWQFIQGSVAQDKSYCAKQGLTSRQVTDAATCSVFGLDTCMVCVLPDGKTVEVTKYMNLSFDEEGVCGDKICTMSEVQSCPKDCPPSVYAPPSSVGLQGQPPLWMLILGAIVLMLLIAGGFLLLKKKPEEKSP